MKTIEQIESRIRILLDNHNPENPNKKEKIEFTLLKFCLNYLKTNPDEGFLKNEILRLKKEIEIIDLRYNEWLGNQNPMQLNKIKDIKAYYNSLNDVNLKYSQIKTIEFLLNNENIES